MFIYINNCSGEWKMWGVNSKGHILSPEDTSNTQVILDHVESLIEEGNEEDSD